jgi:hypothetical protein
MVSRSAPFSALSLPCSARSVCLRSEGEGANPPCLDALILLDSLIQFLLRSLMLMLLVCRLRSSITRSLALSHLTISFSLLAYINISCRLPCIVNSQSKAHFKSYNCTHTRAWARRSCSGRGAAMARLSLR